jgi:RsmE family RNA methyltransferase
MNILLLDPAELDADGRARIEGRRAEHIRWVLAKGIGDEVRAGIEGGGLGTATIEQTPGRAVVVRCQCDDPPPAKGPVHVVLALPRPPVLRRLLGHLTALGVPRITLLHTRRVEKSYWHTPALEPEAVAQHLRLGLEQAVDTVLPIVEHRQRFRPFVEDELVAAGDPVLVAHPGRGAACPVDVTEPTTLVIGPEGGLVGFEVDLLAQAGASFVDLGPRILRVETAAVAAVARLHGH